MVSKTLLYLNTLRWLKPQQLWYQLKYKISRPKFVLGKDKPVRIEELKLIDFLESSHSYLGNHSFQFLNLDKDFGNSIKWNFNDYGKLWTYNLSYFDFLNQANISQKEGLYLINDFIYQYKDLKDGFEPFPTSLRGVNWIKFLIKNNIKDVGIDRFLFYQFRHLSRYLEKHLLGNHLLENGFSLLWGAIYFKNENLFAIAKKIINTELNEQILKDGAHFEQSPMYHQIILGRTLDAINLLSASKLHFPLKKFLESKASSMLGWMEKMVYRNGSLPRMNDTADEVFHNAREIQDYALRLNIKSVSSSFSDSGYRRIENKLFEITADIGGIKPTYIPGHSHCDSLHFELQYLDKPIIVDTGISTYEKDERRQVERSTSSHNTVMVEGEEQHEIWGGFRIARRGKVINIKESKGFVQADFQGYRSKKIIHTRSFELSHKRLKIIDTLNAETSCRAFLHFHPACKPTINNREIRLKNLNIKVEGCISISMQEYDYAIGFNHCIKAQKAIILFNNNLITEVTAV